jgi:gas vesicle protein
MSDNNGPNTSGVIIGLAIGAALGAGLALLLAPRSGKETREIIAKKSKEACDLISQKSQELTDKASEVYSAAASTVEAKKAELQAAYDAGRAAMLEERAKRNSNEANKA